MVEVVATQKAVVKVMVMMTLPKAAVTAEVAVMAELVMARTAEGGRGDPVDGKAGGAV